jgi:hypothetical protein
VSDGEYFILGEVPRSELHAIEDYSLEGIVPGLAEAICGDVVSTVSLIDIDVTLRCTLFSVFHWVIVEQTFSPKEYQCLCGVHAGI